MEAIIPPIEKELLCNELNKAKKLCCSRKTRLELYLFDQLICPNLMFEVGRLREISFRGQGGGTGNSCDIDEYDRCFHQLIAWDTVTKTITGGYRIAKMGELLRAPQLNKFISPSNALFNYSADFMTKYCPRTLEMGRSFVNKDTDSKMAFFSLYALFEGLSAYINNEPELEYLFGKVTFYPQKHKEESRARNMAICYEFIKRYFKADDPHLISPLKHLEVQWALVKDSPLTGNYEKDIRLLVNEYKFPQLFNTYASLSKTMKSYGIAKNEHFGNTEEAVVFVAISDIIDEQRTKFGLK